MSPAEQTKLAVEQLRAELASLPQGSPEYRAKLADIRTAAREHVRTKADAYAAYVRQRTRGISVVG